MSSLDITSEPKVTAKSVRVAPAVGEFSDVETGLVFVIPFTIQNLSTVAKNVRFVLPKTPVFRIANTPQVIAPGLKHTVEVEFFTKAANDYHDQWSVITDDGRIDIPLHAIFPCASIQVPSAVDLGKVMVQHNVQPTRSVRLTNVGKKDGHFKFMYDTGVGLTISPPYGIVKQGAYLDIKVDYFGAEVGVFTHNVSLELDDNVTRRVDVTAEVIDARVSVLHPLTREFVSTVNFGNFFFGQKKREAVLLVNNSPNTVNFTMHPPEEPETNDEDDANDLPIECSTMEGRIPPFGNVEVEFLFQPVMAEAARGWASTAKQGIDVTRKWDPVYVVEVVETEQKIDVQLVGRAFATEVSVTQSAFRFGECNVNDHLEVHFEVHNDSTELPLVYQINRVAHFFATPSVARIPPQGSQAVTVSFHPNQLGRFRNYLTMTVNEGTRVLQLSVSGHSSKIAPKAPPVGGIDKIKTDFKRKPNYVQSETEGKLQDPITVSFDDATVSSEPAWLAEEGSERGMDQNDILLLSEWEQKREHNKLYGKYIENCRTNRQLADPKRAQRHENPDDLGLIPGQGLVPPEPVFVHVEDPLPWGMGQRESKKASAMRSAVGKFDETRVVKKKHKTAPTTLNETRECKLALSPKDIQLISIPVKVIDFGQVSVFSRNVKPFFVHNGGKTHVLVKIPVNIRDELAESNPPSQVIPPGQTACFDIVFRSEQLQKFQQAIFFTLNDNHKVKFGVFAEVMAMDVALNQDEMSFRFTEFILDPFMTQNVVISNPGNADAEVEWDLSAMTGGKNLDTNPLLRDFAFGLKPERGVVPANGTLLVEVTYYPILSSSESSNEVTLKVKGGPSRRLSLKGSYAPTQVQWSLKESKVDFKKIAVGSTRTQLISLRNTHATNWAVFAFDQNQLINGLSVTPSRGRIQPGLTQEVTLQLRALHPQIIRTTVTCHVRGMMKNFMKLLVFGEAKIPEFMMSEPMQELLDFGGVYVGSHEMRKMEIENRDDLATTFFVDLSAFPDFSICDSDKRAVEVSSGDDDETVKSGPGHISAIQSTSNFVDDESSNVDGGMEMDELRVGQKYRIIVNARQTMSWYLCYSPTAVCHQDSFHFPIVLAGSDNLSEVALPESCNLNHIITFSGKRPRLVFSPNVVDFGQRVVMRDGTTKSLHRVLVQMTNETDQDLEWELDDVKSGLKDQFSEIFRAEPTHGRLHKGQNATVQFTFTPLEVRAYVVKVPVYLDGNRTTPYMTMIVKGCGANPSLTFDRKEVILPIVPLNIPARMSFVVQNDGYESLDMRYRIPGDGRLPITLNFPEGQIVSASKTSVPVEVVFQSSKAISFSTVIDFYGDDGTIFPIIITAGADNSIMSTYGYIKWRDVGMQFVVEDKKPVIAKEIEDTPMDKDGRDSKQDAASASVISAAIPDDPTMVFNAVDKSHKKVLTKKAVDRLRSWLNANVLADPVDDLVTGLQANHCRLIFDILESLFGKQPPGLIKPEKLSSNKRECALQELEQLNAALTFLRQYGAVIPDVRAEYLLKYEDFCRISINDNANAGTKSALSMVGGGNATNASVVTGGGASRSRVSERKFQFRCVHAWCTVLYQTARMFVVNKITWKSFRTLPQNQICTAASNLEKWSSMNPDNSIMGSNVYSVGEALLLKWLSIHVTVFFPRENMPQKERPSVARLSSNKSYSQPEELLRGDMQRITSFEELRDCKAFAAVLMGYIPSIAKAFDRSRADGFMPNPTAPSELERNAAILLDAMKEYGMDLKLSAKEFLEGNGRDAILFSAYLYNTLPQYVPKTTIKFRGKLHEKITKTIELSNPTKWGVDYQVLLDGCDEFILENKLHLDPRSSGTYTISITPRFTKKVDARITFLSNRAGAFSGATMVFQLETEIDTDSCMKTVDDLQTTLYDVLNYELEIENPFNAHGHFSVSIKQERIKDGGSKPPPEADSASLFPDAFWTQTDVLNIKKGEKGRMILQFLPFVRGRYRCKVQLCDDKVGEFAYDVFATCTPPKPFDIISVVTEANQSTVKEITIPVRHVAFDKAMTLKEERFKAFKGRNKVQAQKDSEVEPRDVTYTIEFVNEQYVGPNPFYQGPKYFTLKPPAATKGAASPESDAVATDAEDVRRKKKEEADRKKWQITPTSFNVSLHPKGPGLYPSYLILTSPYDIRCIAIEGRSRSPGMKAELDFACPARQQIVQEIPLANTTDREWVISATIQGEFFSGVKEIRVPAGRTRSYTLTFLPTWMCDVTGQLQFKNVESQEKYTYTLRGRAEEPLAENTIQVECRARENRRVTISVPNITNEEVSYSVETDLPFVQGDQKIMVGRNDVGKYTLIFNPQLSCKVTGSITFIAPNKQYLWYVVSANVLRPPPEATIEVEAVVRKAVAAEITITNPANHVIDFAVRRRGDGLIGEDTLTLEPSQSYIYQLIFAPIKAGSHEGAISFYNDDVGEYWYKLSMTAKEAEPETLQFLCELGKSKAMELYLENPTEYECNLTIDNTNSANYVVAPQNVVLRPNGSTRVVITYMPSAIHQEQPAAITFSHPRAGQWQYNCKGKGTPPTRMEPTRVQAQVNYAVSATVVFRNPFPVPKKFVVSMAYIEGSDDMFSLSLKKKDISLSAFDMLQIPLAYHPKLIAEHRATVIVGLQEGAQELKWEFPILGVAEAVGTEQIPKISCKSRKEITRTVELSLVGLMMGTLAKETFTHEIVVPSGAKYAKAVASSVIVTYSTEQPNDGSDRLRYEITFCPLRPFSQTVQLQLRKSSGGVWRYELELEATPPDPDDVITIASGVHMSQSVSFSLYNVFPTSKPFQAYFTADSAMELTVKPPRGVLPAMEAAPQGQTFVVTFSSSSYGKTVAGTLVVDTDEIQWRYDVHGVLPKYQAPTEVASRLDTHLSPEVRSRMSGAKTVKRNFVKANQKK